MENRFVWLFFDCESTSSPQQRPQTKSWKQRACVKRKSLKREKRLVQSVWVSECVCDENPLYFRSVWVSSRSDFQKWNLLSSTSIQMFKPPFHLCLRWLRMDWQEWIICEREGCNCALWVPICRELEAERERINWYNKLGAPHHCAVGN